VRPQARPAVPAPTETPKPKPAPAKEAKPTEKAKVPAPPRKETATVKPRPAPAGPTTAPGDEAAPAEGAPVAGDRIVPRFHLPLPRPPRLEVPNFRVLVRLKAGRGFTGIVSRDEQFARHISSGDHLEADLYSSNDSFLLRYVDGLDGHIRLYWYQIDHLLVREVFGAKDMIEMQRSRQVSRLRRRMPSVEGTPEASETAEGQAAGPTLLQRFAPDQGWGTQRADLIRWRAEALDIEPEREEAEFLANLDAWSKELSAWKSQHGDAPVSSSQEVATAEKQQSPAPQATGEAAPKTTPPKDQPKDAPQAGPKQASGEKPAPQPAQKVHPPRPKTLTGLPAKNGTRLRLPPPKD
jgi:hypothetical protein